MKPPQRVLLVDKAGFPSDTISTHLVHAPGVGALARWGLLDRLVDSGCPPITTYSFDFGPFTLSGSPVAHAFDVHMRPGRVVAGMPTHDDLNCLVGAAPRADMEFFRGDVEGNYRKALEQVPEYADRLGSATRESRFVGIAVPMPIYDLPCQLGSMEPPPPDQAQLLDAMAGNQEAMQGFVSMIAGTLPVAEFSSEENAERILAVAQQPV